MIESSFFPPSSHILPCSAGLWTSRRKVSVRMCSVEENGGAGLEGGPARECFIISNVASPQALSKVSELREPGARNVQPPCDHLEQSSSPLSYFRPQTRASAWIMCLNTVVLFIWLNFSPCKFKGAGLPGSLKLTWYAQDRGNASVINTFVAKGFEFDLIICSQLLKDDGNNSNPPVSRCRRWSFFTTAVCEVGTNYWTVESSSLTSVLLSDWHCELWTLLPANSQLCCQHPKFVD